ncbi:MAG: putative O-methyltransferase YrrM, partial [Salibacteraceae bacterium]
MLEVIKFNYIITIYNKEDLIEEVLTNVIKCCGKNSHIYPVLDGCTDNSERIIDEVSKKYPKIPISKVYTEDVHELLTINEGLKSASQEGDGYNIILQDDVVILDHGLEEKIVRLYKLEGPKLGYVSFRLGANLKTDALTSNDPVPYKDYVENAFGHGIRGARMLPVGSIAYRTVPIKSPVCIPFEIIRNVGMYNEELAPYGHDDIDLAIRTIEAGYYNAIFSIHFESDVDWGGTRMEGHLVQDFIIEKNMNYIRDKYFIELGRICSNVQPCNEVKISGMDSVSGHISLVEWKRKVKVRHRLHLDVVYKKILVKIKWVINRSRRKSDYKKYSRPQEKYDLDLSFSEVCNKFKSREETYSYFHHYFHNRSPKVIREHREYILRNEKGFGEDAFHAMWWLLLLEFKPKRMLEIGVYRGQVVSLWALISKLARHEFEIHGVSPFSAAGDSVSTYMKELDYMNDSLQTFNDWGLDEPVFVRSLSTDAVGVAHIKSQVWDLIYIDGSHDKEVVLEDYKLSFANIKVGGLIVFDDSSLYAEYDPASFSFPGHPGPSVVVRDYA